MPPGRDRRPSCTFLRFSYVPRRRSPRTARRDRSATCGIPRRSLAADPLTFTEAVNAPSHHAPFVGHLLFMRILLWLQHCYRTSIDSSRGSRFQALRPGISPVHRFTDSPVHGSDGHSPPVRRRDRGRRWRPIRAVAGTARRPPGLCLRARTHGPGSGLVRAPAYDRHLTTWRPTCAGQLRRCTQRRDR